VAEVWGICTGGVTVVSKGPEYVVRMMGCFGGGDVTVVENLILWWSLWWFSWM
jgi:hypothetical protein